MRVGLEEQIIMLGDYRLVLNIEMLEHLAMADSKENNQLPTLSEEQLQKTIKWLDSKTDDNFSCPVCGALNWHINPVLQEMRTWSGGNPFSPGQVTPLIAVRCKNCSYVALFQAINAGIIPSMNKTQDVGEEERLNV